MTTWVKDNGGTLQYAAASEFKGIPNWQTHEYACRQKGYLPLSGEAEPREGYNAVPATWHKVEQSMTRTEPRQGGDGQMHDTEITLDRSYIQIDTWDYEPIPVPQPEPVRYSKYKIQLACQKRNLWGDVKEAIANANLADSWANIVDIASDNPELQTALPAIKTAFGAATVEAVLAESIAD